MEVKTGSVANQTLVPNTFGFLKSVFASFERIKWLSAHVVYKPAVGTTIGGLITFGADWDATIEKSYDRKKIGAYSPTHTCAIWCDTGASPMVLPPQKLAGRLWYTPRSTEETDKGPCTIVALASGPANDTVVGEIWITYNVILSGTRGA